MCVPYAHAMQPLFKEVPALGRCSSRIKRHSSPRCPLGAQNCSQFNCKRSINCARQIDTRRIGKSLPGITDDSFSPIFSAPSAR